MISFALIASLAFCSQPPKERFAEGNSEELMRAMDGFRKKLPEPQGLGEQNGLGVGTSTAIPIRTAA